MKNTLFTTTMLLAFFSAGAVQATEVPAPCQNLMNDISRKIVRNGVPATDFKLLAVPKEEASRSEGKVVGACGFGSHRVMYIRGANINPDALQTVDRDASAGIAADLQQSAPETAPPAIKNETVELIETTVEDRVQGNNVPQLQESNGTEETSDLTADSDLETEAEPPKPPQPEIIITSPENNPLFQSQMGGADSPIIIHR